MIVFRKVLRESKSNEAISRFWGSLLLAFWALLLNLVHHVRPVVWGQGVPRRASQPLACRLGCVVLAAGREQGSTRLHFPWVLGEDVASDLHLGPIAEWLVPQTHFLLEVSFWNICVWKASILCLNLPSYRA